MSEGGTQERAAGDGSGPRPTPGTPSRGGRDSLLTQTLVDPSGDDAGVPQANPLERGAKIGRYLVLERVGAGGMGVVYAAYDPDLDRRVAIKLLHHDISRPGSLSGGHAMLLREAQAMAKLSHPNVVAVHDVGVHDGVVFVAMEFVQGRTVAEWIAAEARPWRAAVEVFVAAARGLEAAHAAGLVHRDFKPANVLLSADGAVKVTDFGLARWRGDPAREPTDDVAAAVAAASTGRLGSAPTQAGAVMGTPAYMAPEQHLGLPIDARSDQFSFCIALYEALYGKRPFTAAAPSALAMDIVEGRLPEPPAGTKVPTWLRELLVRGLEPDPERRHPSMAAIIAQLERDPNAARRTWMFGLGATGVLGAVLGVQLLARGEAPCSDMGRHLVGVWDGEVRERVRDALFATGVGFAASTWERVEQGVDAYAEAWTAAREDACAATRIRGDQSEALLDLRMACLDGRLHDVRAMVGVLADADQTVVANAVAVVAALPPLGPCADAQGLGAAIPRPDDPSALAALELAEQRLAEAEQYGKAGKYPEALALARAVFDEAAAIGYAPMDVRALRRRGALEHTNGLDAEAEQTLAAAYFLAVRNDDDDLAAQAAAELVTVVGEVLQRPVDARRWAEHAAAHADAEGDGLLQAAVPHALAGVALRQGEYAEARELAARGLALRESLLGPEHDTVLSSINMLGLIAIETGRYDEARAYFERALGIATRKLGPDHPELAKPINNLANIAWRQGKYAEAKAAFERALALQRAALGEGHRNVAQLENNLAAVAMSTGDHEEAGERFLRALAIWREALGPEHPLVADALNNLAVVAAARGEFEQAREYDEKALAIREKTMPSDHPALAQNFSNLGTDLYRLGRVDEALALHQRALAIYEKKLDPSHDDIALTLTALGDDLLAQGKAEEALRLLERALQLREGKEIAAADLAQTRWSLARALSEVPHGRLRDPARARGLALQARVAFAASPGITDNPLAAIDAWLARP